MSDPLDFVCKVSLGKEKKMLGTAVLLAKNKMQKSFVKLQTLK